MSTRRTVLFVVVAAVALRLPFLTVLPSPDEAGLLLVAEQWGPGESLYGDLWVDRPPILIIVFQLAGSLGGVPALRVVGLVAVAVTVIACAAAAGRLAGERAARWAAVAAGLLMVSPWLGGDRVNAELLAAPWTAVGLYAAVRAVQTARLRWALLTGAVIAGAILTKQNQADGAVFAVVLLLVSVFAGDVRGTTVARLAAGAAVGALVVVTAVVLGAWVRGTAPGELFDALFTFRLRAAEVIAATPGDAAVQRRSKMLARSIATGHVLLVFAVLLAPLLRRFRSPAALALSLTVGFACFSIVASGSWWNHYLIEFAAPIAVGTGLIAARSRLVVPVVIGYAAAAALVGMVVIRPIVDSLNGSVAVGRMIAAASEPGDSVVHAWGRADLVHASGLGSPYEHLWSLPVRTDDPRLEGFISVTTGADAPTWLVTRGSLTVSGLDAAAAQQVVDQRYRPVGSVCGHDIWLHRAVERDLPPVPVDDVCE